ncbi:MAG TPA: TetR/AcrR family transcriptional regulator [Bacteroidetes bacterium]|nr:TetR/AcrR family transcriptional regulator [Bacteroidota bacterium]
MNTTKEKILAAALKLFNRDGMVNVRLQHIADEAFVSVGNLAYHYKNKEAILLALYKTLTKKQQELLAEYRTVPLFDNIDRLILHTFQLQREYVFFYLDTLEIVRAYPSVGEAHQQHIASQVGQLKFILDFNASRGALAKEPMDGVFEKTALQIWMTMDFWLAQQAVRKNGVPSEQDYRATVWNIFIPYFTDMGTREYEQMLKMPYGFYF